MSKTVAELAYERCTAAYLAHQGAGSRCAAWDELTSSERAGWEAAGQVFVELYLTQLKETDGYTPLPECPTCRVRVTRAIGRYGEPFYCKPCGIFWVQDLTKFRSTPEGHWVSVQVEK
jgi:hypothetical protein